MDFIPKAHPSTISRHRSSLQWYSQHAAFRSDDSMVHAYNRLRLDTLPTIRAWVVMVTIQFEVINECRSDSSPNMLYRYGGLPQSSDIYLSVMSLFRQYTILGISTGTQRLYIVIILIWLSQMRMECAEKEELAFIYDLEI